MSNYRTALEVFFGYFFCRYASYGTQPSQSYGQTAQVRFVKQQFDDV